MDSFVLGLVFLLLLVLLAGPVILLVLYVVARDRIKKLEGALGGVRETLHGYEERLHGLEQRFAAGEDARPPLDYPGEVAAADRAAHAQPIGDVVETPAATAEPLPGEDVVETPAATAEPLPREDVVAAAAPTTAAAGGAAGTRKVPRSSADWEEIIGGNWLNKIGAVVTVIGIALALGYSMQFLGPAGRVALALAASGAMLGLGAMLEDRERYRVFARGLIGGGWAGLYFTTFAMHGLEAARIVESPAIGTALLIAVAAAMVMHSLVYRSETVTGLAYLVTFGTLAIAPMSRYALFASLPAAASLLYVARRFRWSQMMVAGVVFTYGAYLVRGGAPDVGPQDWVFGQVLLVVYWLLFEAFDLASLRERRTGAMDETLMPLNAAGFIGASLLGWSAARPDSLWAFFVLAASMFAASAALRGLYGPARAEATASGEAGEAGEARQADQTRGGPESGTSRVRADGYQVALAIAAAMLALGIERGFDGWRESVAWLLEAQLLVLGGLAVRDRLVRQLGSFVLMVPVLAWTFASLPSGATFNAFGHTWQQATPLALLIALALYADRALLRRAEGVRIAGLEHLYNWLGTFMVAALLAGELPDLWIAPAWFMLGLALIAMSFRHGARELYLQGWTVVGLAWALMMLANVPADRLIAGVPARWSTALPMIVALYAIAYALERRSAAVAFGAATAMAWWFLGFEVSGRWLTVAWGLQGAALLVAGFVLRARRVRLTGLTLLGVCIGKLFVYDAAELDTMFQIASFIILGALLLAVSFAYGRYREQLRRLL